MSLLADRRLDGARLLTRLREMRSLEGLATCSEVVHLLAHVELSEPDAETLLDLMGQDKKVIDGQVRFILARGIGKAFVTSDVPRDMVRTLLQEALDAR